MIARSSVALIVVTILTLLFSRYFHPYWVRAFLDGRTFEATWGWWSIGWLSLTWGYDVLLTLIAASFLALLLPRGAASWWYVGLGVTISGMRLLSSRNFLSPNADMADLVWIYGSYAMSALGATLGGAVARLAGRLKSKNLRVDSSGAAGI
jgi:hypothetical protein